MLVLVAFLQDASDSIDWGAVVWSVAQIILAAGAVAAAARQAIGRVRAELGRKIDQNTQETVAAKDAAEKAAEQVNWRQKFTAASLELDDARRRLALVSSLPECLPCRLRIQALLTAPSTGRRHTDPPPLSAADPPQEVRS